MKEAPILETERLWIRPHKLDDFPECVSMWKSPIVARYTTLEPSPEQKTWTRMLSYLGHWKLKGFGYWAVEEKETSRFIGEIGFADNKRGIPEIHDIPEAGWALAPHAQGKGFASEAMKKILEWGDSHFEQGQTVCLINPANLMSIKLAKKLGYVERETLVWADKPTILLSRDALYTSNKRIT